MQLSVSKFSSLADAVAAKKAEIDEAAGATRSKYITAVPGQAETYLRKSDDAKAYIAAGSPSDSTSYPWVKADAEAYGITPGEAAEAIMAQEAAWRLLGTGIEIIRLGCKKQLDQATTTAQVNRIATEAIQKLEAV
ncbi:MAG: hypothetical protein PVI97_13995 [Candidatus Thiodiazotropha sp.]